MRQLKSFLIVCAFIGSSLLGLSTIAANLSTAFPPPPSATLTVPIIILQGH
jgi:hypothetical protein